MCSSIRRVAVTTIKTISGTPDFHARLHAKADGKCRHASASWHLGRRRTAIALGTCPKPIHHRLRSQPRWGDEQGLSLLSSRQTSSTTAISGRGRPTMAEALPSHRSSGAPRRSPQTPSPQTGTIHPPLVRPHIPNNHLHSPWKEDQRLFRECGRKCCI